MSFLQLILPVLSDMLKQGIINLTWRQYFPAHYVIESLKTKGHLLA